MARVRQFAKDMGITYNQAKGLINKGRSRKDGGSQILENVMKKPKGYKTGGSETNPKAPIAKVTKTKLKNIVKKKVKKKDKDPFAKDTTVILNEDFSKDVAKANQKAMEEIKKANGGATDFGMLSVKAGIDKNPNPTQADRIAGATKGKKMKLGGVARGGRSAIQGTGFSGVY
tara:strand:+ start:1170 stop:1688 length:519 start_codon:yes stop_codon:yes gene_type:complete